MCSHHQLPPDDSAFLFVGDRVLKTDLEGPGQRIALFLSGCSLRCPGCCNPHLFVRHPSQRTRIEEYVHELQQSAGPDIVGVSILGGEPMEQSAGLLRFLQVLRERTAWDVMLYSGYTRDAIEEMQHGAAILNLCDVLVDGPYIEELRDRGRRFIGSSNQQLHFLSSRYSAEHPDFQGVNRVELRLKGDELRVLGYPEFKAGQS